ncbi:sensor histidine kinase [Corynebacterium epidermidicanis]|uniref:histidine kinase n=1 Tax=Corynebacterium epidermidicanis TaxID=1050174 RepID=A0A0G3GYJ6_9CORY|nr:HAMP domain-containing sensor histidine kinase [Corynebacterium epidermidicanis]AKK03937.1 signal transduction histidine kinase [Corynebacterium epidermidicanis]
MDPQVPSAPNFEPEEPRRLSVLEEIPLRSLLVMVMVVIAAAGLAASALVVNGIMREFTLSRVDQDLTNAATGWAARNDFLRPDSSTARPPSDFYVQKIFQDGSRLILNDSDSAPNLSEVKYDDQLFTVGSAAGGDSNSRWRVISRQRDGIRTIVALNLRREDRIIDRLMATQIVIGLIVLSLLGLVSFWGVRKALRPLRDVERTAASIAAGDLDRRVPSLPTSTEVGRLSVALNVMLSQLQRSIEESRSKEEQMRRFVGDASHELRTPLTSLRGYTELYQSGAMPDADKVLAKVNEEAGRMGYLVEDLLSLTRAEGSPTKREKVDIFELVLNVASSMRAAHPNRMITVTNDADDVPIVLGDQLKIHRVFTNLINNGLVHGGADVTVRVRLEGTCVCVDVIDNGCGMSEEVASHVFERFYRADSSRSRASGGSGLGLAIVKSLVEQHQGSVTVESELGVGTTFTVCLPRSS